MFADRSLKIPFSLWNNAGMNHNIETIQVISMQLILQIVLHTISYFYMASYKHGNFTLHYSVNITMVKHSNNHSHKTANIKHLR